MKTNTNIYITEHNLSLEGDPNSIKIIAEALREYMTKHEVGTTLADFTYNMETAYQSYHGLSEDNWDFVECLTDQE